jgi:putative transcriptional regulator
MSIIIHLDVMLAKRKMRSKALAEVVGLSEQTLSLFKTGKAIGIRFATLNKVCAVLSCTVGELIERID